MTLMNYNRDIILTDNFRQAIPVNLQWINNEFVVCDTCLPAEGNNVQGLL
jgi:hypothetical protein